MPDDNVETLKCAPLHLSTPNIERWGRTTGLRKALILLTQMGAFRNLSN